MPFGTVRNQWIYLFKTKQEQKKPRHNDPSSSCVRLFRNSPEAKIIVQRKEYVYKNGSSEFWFGLAGNNHQLIKKHYEIYLPRNWRLTEIPIGK
ncbi:MAG: DUF4811 domain-containing protein [Sporolactobacillus sp.]